MAGGVILYFSGVLTMAANARSFWNIGSGFPAASPSCQKGFLSAAYSYFFSDGLLKRCQDPEL